MERWLLRLEACLVDERVLLHVLAIVVHSAMRVRHIFIFVCPVGSRISEQVQAWLK